MEREQIETRKKNEKTDETLAWILGFEKQAGKPVIVSLLVEDGCVHFEHCTNKERIYADGDCDCDGPSEGEVKDIRKPSFNGLSGRDYLG